MPRRAVAGLAALAVTAAAGGAVVVASAPDSGGPEADAAPPEFRIVDPRVSPRRAYFAGRPVQFTFRVAAPAPVALQIEVVRNKTDEPVRTIVPPPPQPGAAQRVEWDGLTGRGEVAPNGGYRIRIRGADGRVRRGATFRLRSHH